MTRTLEKIRTEGLDALCERLGRAGMIRFLQQFETGTGDYARERRDWAEATSLAGLQTLSSRRRAAQRKKK